MNLCSVSWLVRNTGETGRRQAAKQVSERRPAEASWSLTSEVHLVTKAHPGHSFALYIIARALNRELIKLDLLPGSVAN